LKSFKNLQPESCILWQTFKKIVPEGYKLGNPSKTFNLKVLTFAQVMTGLRATVMWLGSFFSFVADAGRFCRLAASFMWREIVLVRAIKLLIAVSLLQADMIKRILYWFCFLVGTVIFV
jgi:hypothetical protein